MPSRLPDLSRFKPDDDTVDSVERMLERGASRGEMEADLYAAAIASRLGGASCDPLSLSRIWLGWALCELHTKRSLERERESSFGRTLARELALVEDRSPEQLAADGDGDDDEVH